MSTPQVGNDAYVSRAASSAELVSKYVLTDARACLCCNCLLTALRDDSSGLHVDCAKIAAAALTWQRGVSALSSAIACCLRAAVLAVQGLRQLAHSIAALAAAPAHLSVVLPPSAVISSTRALHASIQWRSAARAVEWRGSSLPNVYAGLHRAHSVLSALLCAFVRVHQQQCISTTHAATCTSPSRTRSLTSTPAFTALC
jgi:hypothetical protein